VGRNPELSSYIRWTDVIDAQHYLGRGYGCRILLKQVVACPPGEQFHKMYWEAVACDESLEPLALPQRALAQWPSTKHRTMAGMMLALLYELDSIMADNRLWTEPTFTKRPQGAPART